MKFINKEINHQSILEKFYKASFYLYIKIERKEKYMYIYKSKSQLLCKKKVCAAENNRSRGLQKKNDVQA